MKPQVQGLRDAASQSCSRDRAALRKFYGDGLEDILLEAETGGWEASEIAAQVLVRCCVEDGRFNGHVLRFKAVMVYLNQQRGRLKQGEEQAFRDLLAILNQSGRIESVREWMKTNYT
jgi:hypothetical protein